MPGWMNVALIIAVVIAVIGVAILILRGAFHVTGIEIGIPPKLIIAPRSAKQTSSNSRIVRAKGDSRVARVDMTGKGDGEKVADARDGSTLEDLKM